MIASEDPWVRAPVVSPGAWKRSASIRIQRCSISAVRGYSAWSMKFRCRFAAMICWACGSIHVVTKVARFRAGSPSSARSSDTSRKASSAGMPVSGNSRLGTSWVTNRLPNIATSASAGWEFIDITSPQETVERGLRMSSPVRGNRDGGGFWTQHQNRAGEEAQGSYEGAESGQVGVPDIAARRYDKGRQSRDAERNRAGQVDHADLPHPGPGPAGNGATGIPQRHTAGNEEGD